MRDLRIQCRACRSVIGASSDPPVRGMGNGTSQRSQMACLGMVAKVEGMKRDFRSLSPRELKCIGTAGPNQALDSNERPLGYESPRGLAGNPLISRGMCTTTSNYWFIFDTSLCLAFEDGWYGSKTGADDLWSLPKPRAGGAYCEEPSVPKRRITVVAPTGSVRPFRPCGTQVTGTRYLLRGFYKTPGRELGHAHESVLNIVAEEKRHPIGINSPHECPDAERRPLGGN